MIIQDTYKGLWYSGSTCMDPVKEQQVMALFCTIRVSFIFLKSSQSFFGCTLFLEIVLVMPLNTALVVLPTGILMLSCSQIAGESKAPLSRA